MLTPIAGKQNRRECQIRRQPIEIRRAARRLTLTAAQPAGDNAIAAVSEDEEEIDVPGRERLGRKLRPHAVPETGIHFGGEEPAQNDHQQQFRPPLERRELRANSVAVFASHGRRAGDAREPRQGT